MADHTEYDIVFSIRRRLPGEEDFSEIGNSASCSWKTVDEAAHDVLSMIQNRVWDSEQDIDPEEVDRDEH